MRFTESRNVESAPRTANAAERKPPRLGPTARPTEILPAKRPMTRPRSAAGNVPVRIASGTDVIIPAARPCSARNPTSAFMVGATAQRTDAATKPRRPERKTRR
jgi:hypothetical protein